jgi:hypothetical protein
MIAPYVQHQEPLYDSKMRDLLMYKTLYEKFFFSVTRVSQSEIKLSFHFLLRATVGMNVMDDAADARHFCIKQFFSFRTKNMWHGSIAKTLHDKVRRR